MGNITCIERHINPNLACYRDSDLRICVSLRQYAFKIGVSQQHSRLPLALVEYDFSNAGLPYRECLRQIVEQEALLDPDFNYGQQTFTVPDAKSTLIPACFYEAQHAKDYISAIYPLTGKECISQEQEPYTRSCILTAFNPILLDAARQVFPQKKKLGFLSTYACLIRELFRLARSFRRFPVIAMLHTQERSFNLCVKNEDGLLYINTFPFQDEKGLLYYTLYALNKLKLDLGSIALFLCGSAADIDLQQILETHINTTLYLPAASKAPVPKEIPYSKHFTCL